MQLQMHSGMPKFFDFLGEILKSFVTCNDSLWTENKAYSWRLRDPSNEVVFILIEFDNGLLFINSFGSCLWLSLN
jgi:hypothetical protein